MKYNKSPVKQNVRAQGTTHNNLKYLVLQFVCFQRVKSDLRGCGYIEYCGFVGGCFNNLSPYCDILIS